MSREKTFAAFSCTHFPDHDPDGIAWLLKQIRKFKPDYVVMLGDLFDAACLSSFAYGDEHELEAEYESAEFFLSALRKVSPNSQKVWIQGNHEERVERQAWRKVSSLLDPQRHIESLREYRKFPYVQDARKLFTLGQVTFSHGFSAGVHSVKKEAYLYTCDYGLYVYGHTHRPHPVHRVRFGSTPARSWYVNAGTFIDYDNVKKGYMKCKDSTEWGSGVVLGKVDTKHRHHHCRLWDAQLVPYKLAGERVVGGAV